MSGDVVEMMRAIPPWLFWLWLFLVSVPVWWRIFESIGEIRALSARRRRGRGGA